jgi:hypothetical protein
LGQANPKTAKGEAEMAKRRRAQIASRVVDFAADAFVETVVASFSYAIEVRAQIKEDLEELRGFWQREEDDDDEEA